MSVYDWKKIVAEGSFMVVSKHPDGTFSIIGPSPVCSSKWHSQDVALRWANHLSQAERLFYGKKITDFGLANKPEMQRLLADGKVNRFPWAEEAFRELSNTINSK